MAEGTAASRWFYAHGGRRHGPVDVSRLVDLILAGEIPETTLIWHPGLAEWVIAGDLDEIRRELPPPLPVPGPPESDPATGLPQDPPDPAADLGESSGVRRRRKHRHRNQRDRTQWLLPLLVILLLLMIGLWLLLRRMNEVPPGRIILQGSLAGSTPGLSPLPSARSGL
jgi:hypothetical protein